MTAIKKLQTRWSRRTPEKYRKLGKAIALLGTMIQVAVGGMQLSGSVMTANGYFIFVIALAVTQWLGQTITDFATEEDDKVIDTMKNGQV